MAEHVGLTRLDLLTRLLHSIVAEPRVYDVLQTAVGQKYVRQRLGNRIAPLRDSRLVVDIGGGTGAYRELWSQHTRYICLDIDPQKLSGFRQKFPDGIGLNADATNIPLATSSVDVVVCTQVTHHLPDALLPRMMAETARVLKPDGRFVLLDAVWSPWNPGSRLLWRYDRGSFPRMAATMKSLVNASFQIELWEQFSVIHPYFICVARKQ